MVRLLMCVSLRVSFSELVESASYFVGLFNLILLERLIYIHYSHALADALSKAA